MNSSEKIFAIAPMMDWTDRHCRFFHRLMTRRALLYTEMVVADAIVHGDRKRLLGMSEEEHPVALQVGGSEPAKLAEAAAIAEGFGYAEINLNVGCPSDRVQSGAFGACLMREPELVGDCVAKMRAATSMPVTVKCRIGVDNQDPGPALDQLAEAVWDAGCERLWVHARKAWLEGLSPKENREIPPLNYARVFELKAKNLSKFIGINGGIESLNQAVQHLIQVDGAMIGRAAYHNPAILREVDQQLFGDAHAPTAFTEIRDHMMAYAAAHLAGGGKLNQITRHMIGLFHGQPGARRYRQILSTQAHASDADETIIRHAFDAVEDNCLTVSAA